MIVTIALWRWVRLKNSFVKHWASLQLAHPMLDSAGTHWVAVSGGADSIALLHLLGKLPDSLRPRLKAVHVNHGLSDQSDSWGDFCASAARTLKVPFVSIELIPDATECKRLGVEAWARTARYSAIEKRMAAGDVLHCAHHESDQAETLVLALMRGAGPDGQASMPVVRRLGAGWLCRPVLLFSRDQLRAYAAEHQGEWIEDPSNVDCEFDRNFVRAEVLPKLIERWPAANRSLARAASLASASSAANSWFAKQALDKLVDSNDCVVSPVVTMSRPSRISVHAILNFPQVVRAQILRAWVSESGMPTIPFAKMAEVERSVLSADGQKNPSLHWATHACLWRYAGSLWLFIPERVELPATLNPGEDLAVGDGLVRLEPSDTGIPVPRGGFRLTQRVGGERLRKQCGGQSSLLKKFLNESSVLPWWRDQLPLVWSGSKLIAVAGVWQQEGSGGWQLSWSPAPVIKKTN